MASDNGSGYPFEWAGRIPPDALDLGDMEITYPSGLVVHPHEGETAWLRVYGTGGLVDNIKGARAAYRAAEESDDLADMDGLGVAAAEVLTRLVVWTDATDPETGEPLMQPADAGKAELYAAWPAELLMWLYLRASGIEGAAERGKESDDSDTGPSPSKTRRKK